MGNQALGTEYTLYRKPDKEGMEFNRMRVMSIEDQAPFLPRGTLDLLELEIIYHMFVIILGKIIALFKDNCYHMSVRGRRNTPPGTFRGKTGRLWKGALSFFIVTG